MLQLREKATKLIVKQYLATGQIPWSPGYIVYRQQLISETLANRDLLSKFQFNQTLPSGYGYGVDERCVEYPWLFSQLNEQPEYILDAGSTLNHSFILDQPIWEQKTLHILTLFPEASCYWQRGISYLFADLREIPIRDNYYHQLICLSTLEHIGLDNRQFSEEQLGQETQPEDFLLAVKEMRRVLSPGGCLFLTVPFGKYKNIGTQQVFDNHLLKKAISTFAPQEVSKTFFSYTKSGWQLADAQQCANCDYVDWIMLPEATRPAQFPQQQDNAAAARAVACIKLVKPIT
ncbi:MAG: class I SAM-dependent methyltransferase [Okeania sp. SIO2D1]|nr:class I SAM-dependent methyltransferase [Okeania sp. SIO2D1]